MKTKLQNRKRRNNDKRIKDCTPKHPTETPALSPTVTHGEEGTAQPPAPTNLPAEMYHLTILSHNVQVAKEIKERDGTQTNSKFKYIALYMEEKGIDLYLIQETWMEGNTNHWCIYGVTLLNPSKYTPPPPRILQTKLGTSMYAYAQTI